MFKHTFLRLSSVILAEIVVNVLLDEEGGFIYFKKLFTTSRLNEKGIYYNRRSLKEREREREFLYNHTFVIVKESRTV